MCVKEQILILLLLSSGVDDRLGRLWFVARKFLFWRVNLREYLLLLLFIKTIDLLLDEILEVRWQNLLTLDEQMVQHNHLVHSHQITSNDGLLLLDTSTKL